MPQSLAGEGQELGVVVDAHHFLGGRECDDRRVRHASPGVLALRGQEIVGGAEHGCEQQVRSRRASWPSRVDGAYMHRRLRPTLVYLLLHDPSRGINHLDGGGCRNRIEVVEP